MSYFIAVLARSAREQEDAMKNWKKTKNIELTKEVDLSVKTFPENWDSKAPSVGNSFGLFRDYSLNHMCLGIKLFCFSR